MRYPKRFSRAKRKRLGAEPHFKWISVTYTSEDFKRAVDSGFIIMGGNIVPNEKRRKSA